MLEHLELSFEGRPHCGLDDARNIARVLIRMMCDGASIQVNERIHLSALEAKSKMTSQVGISFEVLILFVSKEAP
jgi:3'-5' exoribonuclease 1